MSEHWLHCQIFKGMFSDERAMKYDGLSFFVPQSKVRTKDQSEQGEVLVKTFSEGSECFAVLPTEYRAIIPVKSSDLVPA